MKKQGTHPVPSYNTAKTKIQGKRRTSSARISDPTLNAATMPSHVVFTGAWCLSVGCPCLGGLFLFLVGLHIG